MAEGPKVAFIKGDEHSVKNGALSFDVSGSDKGIYIGDGENAIKVAGTPTAEELKTVLGDDVVMADDAITEPEINDICK